MHKKALKIAEPTLESKRKVVLTITWLDHLVQMLPRHVVNHICNTCAVDHAEHAMSGDYYTPLHVAAVTVAESTCLPAILHSSFFKGSSAGLLLLYGRLIPIASIALAIVFAVYMPPQAPAPGHAFLLMSNLCVSSIRLAA